MYSETRLPNNIHDMTTIQCKYMLQYRCLIVSNIGFWNWNLMQFMLIDLEGFDRDKGENHVEVPCIFASDYAFC